MQKIEQNKTNDYDFISIRSYEKDYLTNNYVVKNKTDKTLLVSLLKSKQSRYPKNLILKANESTAISTSLTYKFVELTEVKNV